METKCSVNSGYILLLQKNLVISQNLISSLILLPPTFKTMQMNKGEPLSLKLVENKLQVLSIKMLFLTMIFGLPYIT